MHSGGGYHIDRQLSEKGPLYARGNQTDASDIDLRFLCGEGVTFSQLLDIQEALEAELGKPLDIATAPPGQMRPSFYNRIVQDEAPLYVA